MRHQFQLSDVGLKLIKSYEGYRPTARQLETGRRVAGYGHAVGKGQPMSLTREEADAVLRDDLAPFEALVNDHIFAPLTQGQFDALVSLAFNIGTDAFLASDVVSATNNGRILDAANAFDIWRMSEINGQIYIIDALVRRRTSEKVLFLRPEKAAVFAPRLDLPPREDADLVGVTTHGPLMDYDDFDTGVVSGASDLSAHRDFTPSRRREDGPAGVLTLSEVYDDSVDVEDEASSARLSETDTLSQSAAPSPIAEAAAEVSERLDALMAKSRRKTELPDSLVKASDFDEAPSKIVPFRGREGRQTLPTPSNSKPSRQDESPISRLDYMKATQTSDQVLSADPGYNDDVIANENTAEASADSDSAQQYILTGTDKDEANKRRRNPNTMPFALMCLTGMTLLGGSLGAIASGFDSRWGMRGEMASNVGVLVGGMLLLGSLYYVIKIMLRR